MQFFTPGTHEITAQTKDGLIKGKLPGIKVLGLEPNLKLVTEQPNGADRPGTVCPGSDAGGDSVL